MRRGASFAGLLPLAGMMLAATVLATSSARGQDATTWVEGHVFNKWTGVPLENVVILFGPYRPPRPGSQGATPHGFTDANGFYSVSFFEGYPTDALITAVCFLPPNDGDPFPHFAVESSVQLRPGTMRRDLYIDGPRQKSFDTCRIVPFPRASPR